MGWWGKIEYEGVVGCGSDYHDRAHRSPLRQLRSKTLLGGFVRFRPDHWWGPELFGFFALLLRCRELFQVVVEVEHAWVGT